MFRFAVMSYSEYVCCKHDVVVYSSLTIIVVSMHCVFCFGSSAVLVVLHCTAIAKDARITSPKAARKARASLRASSMAKERAKARARTLAKLLVS